MIKLTNISKSFLGHQVLSDFNLEVPAGRLTHIKGASGSGKSTLLHIIAGLEFADTGKVEIDNKTVSNPNILIPPHKRGVSLLFQDLALWPHMTGRDNLKLVCSQVTGSKIQAQGSNIKDDHDDYNEASVNKVCSLVGFPKELLDKYPSQLSGGEQQRLAIARAIIGKPKILLLDEPFTALDQELRTQFVKVIHKLRDEGTTIILVSHDLLENTLQIDTELFLENGRIV